MTLRNAEGRLLAEAIWAPLFLASAAFVFLMPDSVPRISCVFRMLTGLPCMTCGSTRAMLALGALDVRGAFVMNPLMSVLMLGAMVYVFHAALVIAGLRRPWRFRLSRTAKAWLLYGGGFLIAVNWGYLLWVGR